MIEKNSQKKQQTKTSRYHHGRAKIAGNGFYFMKFIPDKQNGQICLSIHKTTT